MSGLKLRPEHAVAALTFVLAAGLAYLAGSWKLSFAWLAAGTVLTLVLTLSGKAVFYAAVVPPLLLPTVRYQLVDLGGALGLVNPEHALYLAQPKIASTLLFIDDLFLLGALSVAAARLLVSKKAVRTPLDIPLLLFTLVMLLGILVNGKGPLGVVLGLRLYLHYPFLFYAMLLGGLTGADFKRMLYIAGGLLLLNLPVSYVQYGAYGVGDDVRGLLGYGPELLLATYVMMAAVIYLFIDRRLNVIAAGVALVLLSVPPVLSSVRISIITTPVFIVGALVLALVIVRGKLSALMGSLRLLAAGAGLFAIVTLTIKPTRDLVDLLLQQLQRGLQVQMFSGEGYISRLASTALAHNEVMSRPFGWLTGFGVGSQQMSAFARTEQLLPRNNQLTVSIVELGYAGLLLFYSVLAALGYVAWRVARTTSSSYWRMVAFLEIVLVLYHSLAVIYYVNWNEKGGMLLLFLGGAALVRHYIEQNSVTTSTGPDADLPAGGSAK